MDKIKAWVAGGSATVLAFLGGLSVGLEDGVVNSTEWVTIAILTVTAFAGVFTSTYAAPANRVVEK